MADNESFFRKVVRFVANPATDWTDLSSRQVDDSKELELEKSELKAMIERKRRNDFVRKREFDMLRRVRREGLSPEQLQALGSSSRLDDSEARPSEGRARPDGVKAKIDEIEQQMVGDGRFGNTRSRPLDFERTMQAPPPQRRPQPAAERDSDDDPLPALPPLPLADLPPSAAPAPVQMSVGLPPLSPMTPAAEFSAPVAAVPTAAPPPPRPMHGDNDFGTPFAVEVSEVIHDPELDEPVIAFANADFTQCEDVLRRLTDAGGSRASHAETWLVLFDLYRATGQQQRFESLALEYAQRFGWSAPQWYSLPKLVADAQADEDHHLHATAPTQGHGDVGWVCPPTLDVEAVAHLRSQALQMPLPWVFDWSDLQRIDAEAAMQMSMLMRLWAGQAIEMRWLAGDRLFDVLQEASPTGARDADPAFWLTRLDALRLANRAHQFDETAIDYCVTYEVSPPSWEPTRCKVVVTSSGWSTRSPSISRVSEVSTGFMESVYTEDAVGVPEVAHVELSGQLVGDIGGTLARLAVQPSATPVISVSCARLIRVDFIAAGDLLNWVLGQRNQNRSVHFVDTHRLVALFFGAMGINEHAKVQVRKV